MSTSNREQYYATTHEVRYGDIDRFGHVNHLRLLEFFESARNPFLRTMAEAENAECVLDRAGFVVAKLAADFHHAVGTDAQSVQVRTSVTKLGRSSVTLRYELWHAGVMCVSAATVLVFVEDGRSQPMTAQRSEFLSRYLVPETAV